MKSSIKLKYVAFLFTLLYFNFGQAQETSIIKEGAEVTLVKSDYKFTEGPAVDEHGNVFFTDQPNNRIMKWSVDGEVSVYMENAGRANGLYFDQSGHLLACADEKNELWHIDKSKGVTVLVDNYEGKKLNGPNDVWVDAKGGIYFTDPYYQREWWTRTEGELDGKHVFYLSPGIQKLSIVANNFNQPNGIIGSADGTLLYVADIGDQKTYSYTINPDGTLTNKTLFTEMGSDGMTTDNQGNVYLTGKGVTVFDKTGKQIEQISIEQPWTANVTFGGPNQDTLFITAMNSLYTLKMSVKGVR